MRHRGDVIGRKQAGQIDAAAVALQILYVCQWFGSCLLEAVQQCVDGDALFRLSELLFREFNLQTKQLACAAQPEAVNSHSPNLSNH